MEEKTVREAISTSAKLVETSIKKAWSVLDAASEKKPPSEVLSQKAVRAIQGSSGSEKP